MEVRRKILGCVSDEIGVPNVADGGGPQLRTHRVDECRRNGEHQHQPQPTPMGVVRLSRAPADPTPGPIRGVRKPHDKPNDERSVQVRPQKHDQRLAPPGQLVTAGRSLQAIGPGHDQKQREQVRPGEPVQARGGCGHQRQDQCRQTKPAAPDARTIAPRHGQAQQHGTQQDDAVQPEDPVRKTQRQPAPATRAASALRRAWYGKRCPSWGFGRSAECAHRWSGDDPGRRPRSAAAARGPRPAGRWRRKAHPPGAEPGTCRPRAARAPGIWKLDA